MSVIKQNYDTLNLSLDIVFENHQDYIENPNQVTYFHQLIRLFNNEIRNTIIAEVVDTPTELLQSINNGGNQETSK